MEKIGEGGFGVVYVAEQRERVKRRVALKIIKLGMDTKQAVEIFIGPILRHRPRNTLCSGPRSVVMTVPMPI